MEQRILAPYAVTSSDSRLRVHAEPEHTYRTCFQRDRDRVIHCAAFRRLEAKTQVFLDPPGDYHRTRLTHTLEVAQIARTMARILAVNQDLSEAAALAHDLGHPPYGHAGEKVLNELMQNNGGFEHNHHSLRIVEFLEHPYPDFPGLNLTFETRLCLSKHETRYDLPEPTDQFGPGHAPLEGQIADLADAIAYNSHDLDDALACGLLEEKDLADVQLYQIVNDIFVRQYPKAHRFARQLRCAKALIDLLVQDTLQQTAELLAKFKPQNPDQVRSANEKIIALSPDRLVQLNQLQEFLQINVYNHPQVARAQKKAAEEIRLLFERFVKDPSLLPDRYQKRLSDQGAYRVICDYIAGMTDRFCQQLYQQFRL